MDISEIRVKLVRNSKERLKAVCSVTFSGEFVIRDLKVIEGATGLFVAMPSRKLADHCPKCRAKNHLRARFCNECGQNLDERRADRVRGGRARLHADIAHPINSQCRNQIQKEVVDAYEAELEHSKQPGYQPNDYDDIDVDSNHEADSGSGHRETDSGSDHHEVDSGSDHHEADSGSDYAALIADLKKEAQQRYSRREPRDDCGDQTADESAPIDKDHTPADAEVQPAEAVTKPQAEEKPSATATQDDEFGAGIV
ncbi:MAG: SpoVG family protein [Phycisphaerae bacterium]|nr:SpoVG family protein [Phycisphaerae bacterium]